MKLAAEIITREIVVAIVEACALRRPQVIENLPHSNSGTPDITMLEVLKRVGWTMLVVGVILSPLRGEERLLRPSVQGAKQEQYN